MNEGSYLHRLWKKPPLEVFISIYVFNVTNADAFMRGKEKMKVEELGPYVYQEYLENHNSTFNANGTLSFTPIRRQVFVPGRSVGDPRHDLIIVPNIAYLGVASAAYRMSAWASIAVAAALKPLGMSPFLNITVHDLLWGYEDPLVQVASTLLPNIIHFKKIGILDRVSLFCLVIIITSISSSASDVRFSSGNSVLFLFYPPLAITPLVLTHAIVSLTVFPP